jgi:hypothetical protein
MLLVLPQYYWISLQQGSDNAPLMNRTKQEFMGEQKAFSSSRSEMGNHRQQKDRASPLSLQPQYHIVFSTSCSLQQNWESYVFFYFCKKIAQPGNVTRIASGCNDREAAALVEFHQNHIATMSSSFHLHLTPDYSRVRLAEGKHSYKYMNKPYGMRHWMEEGLGLGWSQDNTTIISKGGRREQEHRDVLDGIVILMDPDMILLRPIGHDYAHEEVLWVDPIEPATKVVRHGYPMAQQDGYLNNEWMKLNFSYITGKPEGEFVSRPAFEDGPKYWNTGPPYLATVKDMYQIVSRWTELTPRVLDVYPKVSMTLVR